MLPNHPPLVVAEQFGMLEALHPGRIDLGIGRAPGTDQITAAALRRSVEPLSDDDFPRQLVELIGFFSGEFPEGHPYRHVKAVPGNGDMPEIWLLGSSGLLGPARRACSGCRSPSPTTSCPATPTRRSSSTASTSSPPSTSTSPTRWSPCAALCAEDDERAR